jgi:hypothetical protein
MAHLGQGGLAQLVERLLCKQDVSGSSPLTSTNNIRASYFPISKLSEEKRFRLQHLNLLSEQASLLELVPARTLKTAYEQEIVR